MNEKKMIREKITKILPFITILLLLIVQTGCKEELTGVPQGIDTPKTRIINVPPQNDSANLYLPFLEISWEGISDDAIIDGFWISIKSYYLNRNDSLVQEPYYTKYSSEMIAFPSADSVNKQVLTVKAVDNYGNVDTKGATAVYYTSKTIPPETEITFPYDSAAFFFMTETTPTWRGIPIICSAETNYGAIQGYSLKIDDKDWSNWQSDSVFYLNPRTVGDLSEGYHDIKIISRNNALVEDPTPSEVIIKTITPTHSKDWLIVDDTKDQSGTVEHPSDEQVDEYYEMLFDQIPHDTWDIRNEGVLSKSVIGDYKYVLWHSDDKSETSLTSSVGLLTDYLNTKGRLIISGWNFYSLFAPNGPWTDSIKFYGNFIKDYLHIYGEYTISEALLDTVFIDENSSSYSYSPIDTNKIWFFRDGLFQVNYYYNLGPFTKPLYYYHTADTTDVNFDGATIGFGYHNSEYQLVVSGFPYYYMTEEGGKKVFLRAKEYLLKDFPY
jgi:hypothetical protein